MEIEWLSARGGRKVRSMTMEGKVKKEANGLLKRTQLPDLACYHKGLSFRRCVSSASPSESFVASF